jgi:hypothetical protein
MGYFGYQFLSLTPEQVAERRINLDYYANLAQISQLLVLILILIVRFGLNALAKPISIKPTSPQLKYIFNLEQQDWKIQTTRAIKGILWSLGNEIVPDYGTIGQWTAAIAWSLWLAFLCIHGTSPGEL